MVLRQVIIEYAECSGCYAVDGKIDEFAFLYQVNHPLACETPRYECGKEAYDKCCCRQVAGNRVSAAAYHLYYVEQRFSQDGRYDHQEGDSE